MPHPSLETIGDNWGQSKNSDNWGQSKIRDNCDNWGQSRNSPSAIFALALAPGADGETVRQSDFPSDF